MSESETRQTDFRRAAGSERVRCPSPVVTGVEVRGEVVVELNSQVFPQRAFDTRPPASHKHFHTQEQVAPGKTLDRATAQPTLDVHTSFKCELSSTLTWSSWYSRHLFALA